MDSRRNCHTKKIDRKPAPKIVGVARNEFGTRLCQRIICSRCDKVDHVSVRVHKNKETFCRSCAEKILATFDQGCHIEEPKVSRRCEQCCRDFKVDAMLAQKKDHLLCNDCLRGFDVWRGKATRLDSYKNKNHVILIRTGSKTTFRKNVNDAIQYDR